MGWKRRKSLGLWRFFTKFVASRPLRPPFDLPEKPTKANLGHGFSPGPRGIRLRHNHPLPVDKPEVIPSFHRVFHTPFPGQNRRITVENSLFSTFSTMFSTELFHSAGGL